MSDTKEFSNEAEEPAAVDPHENNNKHPGDPGNNHHLETMAGNLVASLVDEDDGAPVKTGSQPPPASNNQVILASHWSIFPILDSHWSIFLILVYHWSAFSRR